MRTQKQSEVIFTKMCLSFEFECFKECSMRSRSLYVLWLLRRLEANKLSPFSVTLLLIISATLEKANKQTEETETANWLSSLRLHLSKNYALSFWIIYTKWLCKTLTSVHRWTSQYHSLETINSRDRALKNLTKCLPFLDNVYHGYVKTLWPHFPVGVVCFDLCKI